MIEMNKLFYNKKDIVQPKVDSVILTAAFAILQVEGTYPSVELEGLQLLIGRYALYKGI